MKPYDDSDYALTRIRETVIMHGGKPVEVRSNLLSRQEIEYYMQEGRGVKINGKPAYPVMVKDIITGESSIVSLKDIDPTVPELGYVNYNANACYVARLPKRRDWRQGIRYSNMVSYSGHPVSKIPFSAIGKTLLKEFPSFDSCVKAFRAAKMVSIAWHLDWCLSRNGDVIEVLCQTERVGELVEGRVSLSPEYIYLQEALDESY